MADMGFLPAVRRILDATRPDRQTLLFSATLDGDVDVLVRRYQREPVRHEVTATAGPAGGTTSHRFEAVDGAGRVDACAALVTAEVSSIVFVRTKHGADRLATQLTRRGVPAAAIHGGRSQGQRDRALAAFRTGSVAALVATDVAARGIHVDDVACVIHYDLPPDPKDYVHRSGRTGRAGAEGKVVALVTPEQAQAASGLRRSLNLEITGSLPRPAGVSDEDARRAGPAPGGDRSRPGPTARGRQGGRGRRRNPGQRAAAPGRAQRR